MSEFDKYIVHGEPIQREKADTWQTATRQQKENGLKVFDLAKARLQRWIKFE